MSISKVNIEEANSHLRKLHKKVFELENRIQMQALHVEELQKANSQLQHQLSTVTQERARESQRLEEAENHVQQLLEAAGERDAAVLKLEKKARLFYEVVEHRPAIARILEVLEELSIQGVENGVEGGGEGEAGGEGSSGNSAGKEGKGVTATETSVNGSGADVEATQGHRVGSPRVTFQDDVGPPAQIIHVEMPHTGPAENQRPGDVTASSADATSEGNHHKANANGNVVKPNTL